MEEERLTPREREVLRYALRLLGIRARSEGEMRKRLLARGETDIVEKIIDKLNSMKYLDDADLARNLAERHLLRALHGPYRARQEMERDGIPSDLVQSAIDRVLEEHPEDELLARAMAKELKVMREQDFPAAECRKLFDRLARRGYELERIREAIEQQRRGVEP